MAGRVLITGAAGNLGGFLARSLLGGEHLIRLMVHQTRLPYDISEHQNAEMCWADLGTPSTLEPCCKGVDCVIHFAGKLFAPGPRRFLPITNTGYAQNLIQTARDQGVSRFVLISFPHVEGPTNPDRPATDRRDRNPVSVHARTRLEEENILFELCAKGSMEPVVLRAGMVYARGVLMIDAARRLMQKRLLGVWRKPTWIHLISLTDFLRATRASIARPDVGGVYNLGDERPVTLQEFLDRCAKHWGVGRPWRAPRFMFYVAAWLVELYARLFRTASPLTVDFMRIGMVPYVMDTARMRSGLLSELKYPTLTEGLSEM
jgi:nucleoside-diphosphate-sugar epimerase